ncbi:CPBP family intramembrane glutamic endopeptidase [Salinarchaeum sp. Harcht-Bsk1]|uniref:CPBP family intramembrane glutamic endopeptidase n=1 Tax=Salinarchaeum sp. Harcht-Bsk1 TaxID=1333523 RepID=UPI001651262C|nr:CPBP family intramembrane glutamic endopeptidase [Salinarchaeum sp. Harcht-Bsk1]
MQIVSRFLALTYGISWSGVTLLWFLDVDLGSGVGAGVGTVVFMWAPAIAAIAVLRVRHRSIRNECGLYLGRIRWLLLAWIAPVGLTAVMIAVGLLLPDTTFATEYSAFLLELGMTEEEAAETVVDLEATGVPLIVLLGGMGLALGGTLFALAALGEELGWRGLLLTELAPLGYWKLSLVTGLVWGVWHTPLILLGLQFSEGPAIGIVLLTTATVALSPVYTYLTVRARSVLAATLLHGSFILGVFTSVYLANGSERVISPFGVVGIVAALIGVATCVAHDRLFADGHVTTGEPLRPWSE